MIMKQLIIFLLTLCSVTASAQTFYKLRGAVRDSFTKEAIRDVLLTLMTEDSVKVSQIRSWGSSPGSPNYTIDSIPGSGRYIIRCEKKGYSTTYQDVTLKYIRLRQTTQLIGDILMPKEMTRELKEVVVKATLVKMVMKGDTVVYNAAAFQLARGSMLDELVRQLPGVRLSENGQITVNGRFVSSLMLNGEDFFKGDPKIALDNLPAYMVDKVKVYERQNDRDKALGIKKIGEEPLVMDVNLKKQYSIGWIANADAGYGTNDRYGARFFGLRFSPQTRLSLYGNFNNINDMRTSDTYGRWNAKSVPEGTTDRQSGGMDLLVNDKDGHYKLAGTLTAYHQKEEKDMQRLSTTFFSSGDIYNRTSNSLRNRQWFVNPYVDLQLTPKKGLFFRVNPYVKYFKNQSNTLTRSADFTENVYEHYRGEALDSLFAPNASETYTRILVNRLMNNQESKAYQFSTGSSAEFSSKGVTENDWFTVIGNFNYNKSQNRNLQQYNASYWNMGNHTGDQQTVQYGENHNRNSYYGLRSEYTLGLSTNNTEWRITPGYSIDYNDQNNARPFYTLDANGMWEYDVDQLSSMKDKLTQYVDLQNSYYSTRKDVEHNTYVSLSYIVRKEMNEMFSLNVRLPMRIKNEKLDYQRNRTDTLLRRKTRFFEPQLIFRLYPKVTQRESYVDFNYRLNHSTPDLSYNVDYRDDSTPLIVRLTNPGLKNAHNHHLDLSYHWGKWQKNRFVYTTLYYDLRLNALAQSLTYDRMTGIRTYRPENVNGNWNIGGAFSTTTALDKEKHFTLVTYTNWGYNHSVDYLNLNDAERSIRNTVNNTTLGESLNCEFRKNGYFAGLRGNFNWSRAKGANIRTIESYNYNYGLTGKAPLPWNLEVSADLMMYSRRGYESNLLNTDELVCNIHLSKSILHGNLVFMVDGFDLFKQLSNVRYSVNAQGQTEAYYNVMPRYFMFHVMYKLNREPKKKN